MSKKQKQYAAIYFKKVWYNEKLELVVDPYYHLYTGETLWEGQVVYDDIEEVRKRCKAIESLLQERDKKQNLERLIEGEPDTKPGDTGLFIGYKVYDDPTTIESWLNKEDAKELITNFDDEDE